MKKERLKYFGAIVKMEHGTINKSEIEKSGDLNLSPEFYLTFKPTIKNFIKKQAKGMAVNTDWVDTLNYQSAKILYEVIRKYDVLDRIRKDMVEQLQLH